MKVTFVFVMIFCICFSIQAQNRNEKQTKTYQAWIKLKNSSLVEKGILYEVGDSSVFISNSIYSDSAREYHFQDINKLKIRKSKSVLKGVIWGGSIGLVSGIIIGEAFISQEFGPFGALVATYIGVTYGAMGIGFGALAGTIKDRYPIWGNFDNFAKYKGVLSAYSYKVEKDKNWTGFEHRGYVDFGLGISFASNEFADRVPLDNYLGKKTAGFSSKNSIGYRFSENLGMCFTIRNDQYNVIGESEKATYWNLDAFTLGPVISLSLSKCFRFEIMPAVGLASAYLMVGDQEVYTGKGLGLNLSGSLVYSVSKRWNALFGAGYLSSKQKYEQGGNGKASDANFVFGISYKFGKNGL